MYYIAYSSDLIWGHGETPEAAREWRNRWRDGPREITISPCSEALRSLIEADPFGLSFPWQLDETGTAVTRDEAEQAEA